MGRRWGICIAAALERGVAGRPSRRECSRVPTPENPLALADWRLRVANLYSEVRRAPPGREPDACGAFRRDRNHLFANHAETPLEPTARVAFRGLSYYPYDLRWRVRGTVDRTVAPLSHAVTLSGDGPVEFTRVALVRFRCPPGDAALSLYWLEGYGGGLFLPFRDATCGRITYPSGRYLIDTVKGANLGLAGDEIVLDFNYAYNPSCAYNDRWACPLAPRENWLAFEVPVGEQNHERQGGQPGA